MPRGHRLSILLAIGAGATALAAHQVVLVLLLGVLLGILLDGVATATGRLLGVPRATAARLVLVVLVAIGVFAGARWGHLAVSELTDAVGHAPELQARALERLSTSQLGRMVEAWLPAPDLAALAGVTDLVGAVTAAGWTLAALALVGGVGVAVGVAPDRHARWVLAMVPPDLRSEAAEVGAACHRALQHWLVGRLADMTILMGLTLVGLWWLDVPFALPLALIAGLLEFVPYLGPALSVLPALLVALSLPQPEVVLHVLVLYAALQALQSYVITPLIEQRSVEVPPALGLSVQAVMAVLAGPVAVLVATPLTVLVIVLVQSLYLRDRLHEPVRILGAPQSPSSGGPRSTG